MEGYVMNKNRLYEIIDQFSTASILVIGDIMIDEYIWGKVHRISPEAPVPVVDVHENTIRLGGAANVIQNLSTIGIKPYIASICGIDIAAEQIKKRFQETGCNTEALISLNNRPTTIKTRIMAHNQQVVRVDKEDKSPLTDNEANLILDKVIPLLDKVNGVIISDYGKGVITPFLLKQITKECNVRDLFISVDPKEQHFNFYNNVDVITPNLKEGYTSLGKQLKEMPSDEKIEAIGWEIVDTHNLKYLLLTLSEKGMAIFNSSQRTFTHFETVAKEVYDVTGAGDTVISVFTAAMVCDSTPEEATVLSNHAAGITVGEIGTASVTKAELQELIKHLEA